MAHKILFIAPLPPPVHGSSMVSKYIKESTLIQESFDCDFVNLSTSRTMDEIGKGGLKKIFRFLGSLLTLLGKLLTHRYDLCYIAITCHGMGFLKDAPFALLCKLFGRKLLLHQHNKGMSRDCNRWPYRWLMPLVYRNATVMLLSWHLYEDISAVVKREQVIVCPNGVPPLDNGQRLNVLGLAEGFAIDVNVDANQQSMTAINQRPEGAINRAEHFNRSEASLTGTEGAYSQRSSIDLDLSCQRDEHTNLDAFTHTQACADQDSQRLNVLGLAEGFAIDDNENDNLFKSTEFILGQQNLDTNSQNARIASLACGHPDEMSNLTQTTQKTQNISINADNDTNIDSNSQNAHTQACACHPDGTVDCCLSTVDTITDGAEPRLLMLSNLIVSKGIYVLLEACQRLKEQGVAFHCDYVGGESKEVTGEQFRKAIAERGLTDCVTYHGPQYGADKDRAFRRADIFVQPTFDDCFPLTLVEAMQYRLPIVSTDVGAIPDIVTDGVNGLVCKQQDVDSLVEALTTLLADAALRREMGERGHARYLKEMTLEAFEGSFAEALRSTVNRTGGAG
ncbi:MAG: glycosyltransferase family 4 protein [Alistipes sp.]|nr:glycosyltransferase family 4 protein [Alistipes sp.]